MNPNLLAVLVLLALLFAYGAGVVRGRAEAEAKFMRAMAQSASVDRGELDPLVLEKLRARVKAAEQQRRGGSL